MPVLTINTNIKLEKDVKATLKQLSELCSEMLAKPENYVMIHLNDQQNLMFAGTYDAAASCSLTSLGLTDQHTTEYSEQICQFLESHLNIPSSRIYIEFKAPERSLFGWNKATF